MKNELVRIKAIGPMDAFIDCTECLIGQEVQPIDLQLDEDHVKRGYRKYGWHGWVRTQTDITFPNGEVFRTGKEIMFFDIDVEKV